MAASLLSWGVGVLEGAVTEPAWRKKPSWYSVATDDRIGPAFHVQARAEGVEGKGADVPKPDVVVSIIKSAAPARCRERSPAVSTILVRHEALPPTAALPSADYEVFSDRDTRRGFTT
jgi:hypothetical protein